MNMTSSGIGWGATVNYSSYNGSTISVPVGCTVIVTKGQYSSSRPTAKFNGTFALLSLKFTSSGYGTSYSIVGSSLPLFEIRKDPEDSYQFLGGHSSGSPRRRKGGGINGDTFFNKCRIMV